MNSIRIFLPGLFLFIFFSTEAQRLKKADRTIVANIESHLQHLRSVSAAPGQTDAQHEQKAAEYVGRYFKTHGLKPAGNMTSLFQPFSVYSGRFIQPATEFHINGKSLLLQKEFFPFSFSAHKSTEASVAMALKESGVPWFAGLKDFLEKDSASNSSAITAAIKKQAAYAASKGATAFIVYNNSTLSDLQYTQMDSSQAMGIPVLYLTKEGYNKYCKDEMAIMDLRMTVNLTDSIRNSKNIVGYFENGGDSTVVASASLHDEIETAALIEVARLINNIKKSPVNYLFVVYSGQEKGVAGTNYFKSHPSIDVNLVNHVVNLDTVSTQEESMKGLNLVKHSFELLKQDKHGR